MNLTILILTYNSDIALEKCISSIDQKIPIIVIENSARKDFKDKIEKKYENLKCTLNMKNLGFGTAMNIGLKQITTKYVLTLNPDTVLKKDTISNLLLAAQKVDDFCLLAPSVSNNSIPNYGFLSPSKIEKKTNNSSFEVDYINGFAMFFNLKKFNDDDLFDENFFLYLEEIDLCKRMRDKDERIFVIKNSIIDHAGGESANTEFRREMEYARNWHWMWSQVYFNKKHFNLFKAIKVTIINFCLSFIKSILYLLIFNFNKSKIHWLRLNGLFNAYIGKKAFYRSKLDYE